VEIFLTELNKRSPLSYALLCCIRLMWMKDMIDRQLFDCGSDINTVVGPVTRNFIVPAIWILL